MNIYRLDDKLDNIQVQLASFWLWDRCHGDMVPSQRFHKPFANFCTYTFY